MENISVLIEEIKSIKKKDLIYPTADIEPGDVFVAKMNLFELQAYTKMFLVQEEHDNLHAQNKHLNKDFFECTRYTARAHLIRSVMIDSLCQRIKMTLDGWVDTRVGGKFFCNNNPLFVKVETIDAPIQPGPSDYEPWKPPAGDA